MLYEFAGQRPELLGTAHFIADSAELIGRVRLLPGASVWFGAVLRGDNDELIVGENSNVQDGAVLHTDPGFVLRIGSACTIGHRVVLHGCTIGDGSLVGIGSIVLNGARIGAHSLVGAGSLVPEGKQYPDGVLLLGSPAKVARELQPHERQMLAASAQHYVDKAAKFRAQLQALGAGA